MKPGNVQAASPAAHVHRPLQAVRDSAVILVACAVGAVLVNVLVHPNPIPLVANTPYDILVPCPVSGGVVSAMTAEDPRGQQAESFTVDAREPREFSSWHLPGAMNLTYDYLDATPKALIDKLARRAASSRARRVVVYGDGDNPDSGEQLAKELSAAGIKRVFFIKGGAPALKKAVRP